MGIDSKITVFAMCAIILAACAPETPTPTVPRPTAAVAPKTATPAPTATAIPPSPASSGPLVAYDDPSAPFTLRYPTGWQIREEPESIYFQSADKSAMVQVNLYEYPEPAPSSTTAKIIFDRYAQTNGIKIVRSTANSDGSLGAEVSFQDPGSRAAMQGLVRTQLAKSRKYHFIVLFATTQDQFAKLRSLGQSSLDTFRER
jgi:hypothetical protein